MLAIRQIPKELRRRLANAATADGKRRDEAVLYAIQCYVETIEADQAHVAQLRRQAMQPPSEGA